MRILGTHLVTLLLLLSATAFAQNAGQRATGTFEIKMTPQKDDNAPEGFGRYTIDKKFQGDLDATSVVWMLSAGTQTKGSGAYVALEKVTGKLKGRSGSFVLQHTGTMQAGKYQLDVVVVPDSGTGDLKGLSGKMKIIIEGDKHNYEFDYDLPTK